MKDTISEETKQKSIKFLAILGNKIKEGRRKLKENREKKKDQKIWKNRINNQKTWEKTEMKKSGNTKEEMGICVKKIPKRDKRYKNYFFIIHLLFIYYIFIYLSSSK